MLVTSSSTSVHEDTPVLQHLGSRIDDSKQQIRISEVEQEVIREIVTFAHFHVLHNHLSEGQRQHLLKKYWTVLQRVEQHLQRHKQYLQLSELELARQNVIDQYTSQLTHLSDQIHALQPHAPASTPPEQRILRQLETIRQQITRLK